MCASLWMGAWRAAASSSTESPTPPYATLPRRGAESWNSIRLEGDDDLAARAFSHSEPHVRTLGQGIEGRPPMPASSVGGRTSRALRRVSAMSAWTWTSGGSGGKADARTSVEEAPAPSAGMFIPGERSRVATAYEADQGPRRARQVATTIALLDAFRAHTAAVLARFAVLLETRRCQQGDLGGVPGVVCFTTKDVM